MWLPCSFSPRRLLFAASFLLYPLLLPAEELKVYLLGNSLTDDVLYEGLTNIAAEGGDNLTYGRHVIPGAPIWWLWEHPADGFTASGFGYYPEAFAGATWDAVTLQPFAGYAKERDYARYFAQSLRGEGTFGPAAPQVPGPGDPTGISPEAVLYIYAQWPSGSNAGWDSAAWLQKDPLQDRTAAYYEGLVADLRGLEPATDFYLIPVGHVFHELHQQARAGKIPGIAGQGDWMQDSVHLNDRGSYVAGLTFYTVLYGADPRGQNVVAPYTITEDQATAVQEAVWKVVSRHPLCGLADSLVIDTPSLPDMLVGAAYTKTLSTALADGEVTWSLAAGSLPAGIDLLPDGTLTGTATTPGFFDLTLRAEDASGASDERAYCLLVVSDDPPRIRTHALPAAHYGEPYSVQLQSEGGLPPMTWEVMDGDLPHGLSLSPNGRLSGTPTSVRETFDLTFSVTDAVAGTGTRILSLIVREPLEGTLLSPPLAAKPSLDGQLDEAFWSLPHPIATSLQGSTDDEAFFSVRWDGDGLYLAVEVSDDTVLAGEDALHVFLDGNHDREAVYNVDDRQIVLDPAGSWFELNGRSDGIETAVLAGADGYAAELFIPFSNLDKVYDGQTLTLGLDLAFVDVDSPGGAAAVKVHGATDPDNPAPADMENLVLAIAPLTENLLLDSAFDLGPGKLPYPGQASTAEAGAGWIANGVPSRPFASVDGNGYGYPDDALRVYGDTRNVSIFQVINDQQATTGSGYLHFDVKLASPNTAYRLFGYNGEPSAVDPKIGVRTVDHPVDAGTSDGVLLSGDFSAIPQSATWREVAIPVDFGSGFDYLVLVFSGDGSDTDVDARLDNVRLGPGVAESLRTTGAAAAGPGSTLLAADFTGAGPGLNLPWTRTHLLAEGLGYSGIEGSNIFGQAGDDALFYYNNHSASVSTLEETVADGEYLAFSLQATEGSMDLSGATFQFVINRGGSSQSAERFAVHSSVDGFAAEDALFVSEAVPGSQSVPVAFALPESSAFSSLSTIEFRIYAFAGQYAGKTVSLEELALMGEVDVPDPAAAAYAAWQANFSWDSPTASATGADPNHNGLSNWLEFLLARDPVVAATDRPFQHMESVREGGETYLIIEYDRRRLPGRLSPEASTALGPWSPLDPEADGVERSIIDPDVNGDGNVERVRWKIALSGPAVRFVRLQAEDPGF